MNVGLKAFLLITGIAGVTFWLWPYWELLLVLAAVVLFSIAGYYQGKMRRR
jgi:hypothetical protein